MFFGLLITFVDVAGKKLVRKVFSPTPILKRVNPKHLLCIIAFINLQRLILSFLICNLVFDKKCFTFYVLVNLIGKIREQLCNSDLAREIFVELQNDFDTVDNGILIQNSNCYGTTGVDNNFFLSLL